MFNNELHVYDVKVCIYTQAPINRAPASREFHYSAVRPWLPFFVSHFVYYPCFVYPQITDKSTPNFQFSNVLNVTDKIH